MGSIMGYFFQPGTLYRILHQIFWQKKRSEEPYKSKAFEEVQNTMFKLRQRNRFKQRSQLPSEDLMQGTKRRKQQAEIF